MYSRSTHLQHSFSLNGNEMRARMERPLSCTRLVHIVCRIYARRTNERWIYIDEIYSMASSRRGALPHHTHTHTRTQTGGEWECGSTHTRLPPSPKSNLFCNPSKYAPWKFFPIKCVWLGLAAPATGLCCSQRWPKLLQHQSWNTDFYRCISRASCSCSPRLPTIRFCLNIDNENRAAGRRTNCWASAN